MRAQSAQMLIILDFKPHMYSILLSYYYKMIYDAPFYWSHLLFTTDVIFIKHEQFQYEKE